MTTKEHAARIRADLKARGINSRQASVRIHLYSMGSSIRIKILDGSISKKMVEELASPAEHVRMDQWGEILGGGNRYVFVDYSSEALQQRAAPYMAALAKAAEYLLTVSDNTLAPIEGAEGIHLGRGRWEGAYDVWADCRFDCGSLEQCGNKVATLVEEKAAAK